MNVGWIKFSLAVLLEEEIDDVALSVTLLELNILLVLSKNLSFFVSLVIVSKSTPAYSLIASFIVSLLNGFPRSISVPL